MLILKMSKRINLFNLETNTNNKLIYIKSLVALCFSLFLLTEIISAPLFAQPLAEGMNKFLGNIIGDGNNIHSNFSEYWNQVTPENAGKWGSVENPEGTYNWTQLDKIYNYAISKGFPYKHHCLIWGQQQPSFMNTIDSAQQYQEIVNWIDTTGRRYPNADFCDVVNEPLPSHAPPSYKNALGGDGITGWDWVINAFKLARKYWPYTKLLLNDYGILNSSTNTNTYIEIIKVLQDSSLIDGIGCQAHGFESTSALTIKSNLDKLAATGLPIYISEFDLNIQDDAQQKAKYEELFPVLWEHPAVKGITLWGYIQDEIWKTNAYLLTDRYVERPAMEWLRSYLLAPLKPTTIFPVDTTGIQRNPILVWNVSDSATSYHVQVSSSSRFSSFVIDSTITDTLLQIDSLNANTKYYWRVNASNEYGTSSYSDIVNFTTGEQIVDVKGYNKIPQKFVLDQNYPNPFNPTTHIKYSIPSVETLHPANAGQVTTSVLLVIYDILGKEVTTLVNKEQQSGNYEVTWNAGNLPSGIYFYRIKVGPFLAVKQMILLK